MALISNRTKAMSLTIGDPSALDAPPPNSPSSTPRAPPGAVEELRMGGQQEVTSATSAVIGPRRSLLQNGRHAYRESVAVLGFTITLLRLLGLGYKWLTKLWGLLAFTFFLLPGFLQVVWYYFTSPAVYRSLVYGNMPRNRLDLYMPASKLSRPRPVVIFVTGGAWVIGYKAWGALFGRTLAERGILVACLDYRNFPQAQISQMAADVSTGIQWVLSNISEFGGDPSRVYLVAQSAGAHLSALVLLRQGLRELEEEDISRVLDSWGEQLSPRSKAACGCEACKSFRVERTSSTGSNTDDPMMKKSAGAVWRPRQIKAFVSVSGAYDIEDLLEHWHHRGFYKSIMLTIMGGHEALPSVSPVQIVQNEFVKRGRKLTHLLPPMTLLHGTADLSIPHHASLIFATALREAGARVTTKLYPGKTHTDPIIEDPMRGGRDPLVDDVLEIIEEDDQERDKEVPLDSKRPRMLPELLLELASAFSPF